MHIKARNDDSEDRVFEDKGFFAKGPEFSRVTPDWITSLDSYAIPTMHGGVDAVKPYVDEFIEYAKQHVLKRIFLENLQFKCKFINKIICKMILSNTADYRRALALEEHGQDDDAVWT